jgi:PKHD-type hydroxylase
MKKIPDMNRIPEMHIALDNFIVYQNGFNEDELNKVISFGELAEFQKGEIGSGEGSVVLAETRETDITWIHPHPDTQWIYERMTNIAAKINHDKFQFDLSHFQPFQYGKYKTNGHYNWHFDSGPNLPEHRKLSFVLGLVDPDGYEGGEFNLNVNGDSNKAHIFKIRKGDLIVFPAFMGHRVSPVTSGERLTLTAWAIGPKFR